MRRAWLIARKDMKEAFGRRPAVLRTVVPAVLLSVLYGVMTGLGIRSAAGRPELMRAIAGQIPLFASVVTLLGAVAAVVVTADAIAGEKERRTIETLLATPASDLEIFVGKVVAALVPALGIGYGGGLLYFVVARALAGAEPLPIPPLMAAAKVIVGGVPLLTLMMAAVGVIVSSRCGSVTTANQLSGLLTLPLFGAAVYAAFRISAWSPWQVLLVLLGLVALCAVLLVLGARALGREEIIARLD